VPLSPRAITTENAAQVQLLGCPESVGWVFAFSPDGSLLAASCGSDLCLHDARTLAQVHHLERDLADVDDRMLAAAFSPDGALVALGTSSGMVWLWRVSDGAVERVLEAGEHDLWAVAFSADGGALVASDGLPEVFVWRVADGELLRSFQREGPRNPRPPQPTAVALSPDGALLALKRRGEVRLWRTDDGSLLRVLQGEGISTGDVAFAGDGRFLLASVRAGTVIWERRESDLVLAHTVASDSECCDALSPDGSLLVRFISHRNVLLLRRVEDGARLHSLQTAHGEGRGGLLLSPDGSLLATSGGGVTCLWGLAP
jgi:WD40 repeat protein